MMKLEKIKSGKYTINGIIIEKGGINAILAEYRTHGIHVYKWFNTTV